ncbi:MAG: HAMP domain-containing histidine kinase [Ruminococcus sp.]|nr:HAMP domain-containing histidine kinase [Ruminococcus sp.]
MSALIFFVANMIVTPLYWTAYQNFKQMYNEYSTGSGTQDIAISRAITMRNAVYSDLCMIGTVYLSNCSSGSFSGTSALFNNIYNNRTFFINNECFGIENASEDVIKLEQTKSNISGIDSDYYYFYVEYDGEYLTNIDGIDSSLSSNELTLLINNYSDYYYLRQNDSVSKSVPYDESGLVINGVSYTVSDGEGGKATESESIDASSMFIGAAGKDNYGNYTLCFSNDGDIVLSSYSDDDNYISGSRPYCAQLQTENTAAISYEDLYVEDDEGNYYYDESSNTIVVELDDERFIECVALNNGAYDMDSVWLETEELDNYLFEEIDTSKLTVFMTPKTDLVKAAAAFAEASQTQYNVLGVLRIVIPILAVLSLAMFVLSAVLRPAECYREDKKTIVNSLFKIDLSLIVFVITLVLLYNQYGYYYYSDYYESLMPGIVKATVVYLAECALLLASVYGIIRHIKAYGKSLDKMLIKDIKRAVPKLYTNHLKDRIESSAYVKWKRSLSLPVRFSIRTGIYLAGIFALYAISPLFYIVFILLIVAVWSVLYFAYIGKIIRTIAMLERQIDNMMSDDEKKPVKIASSNPIYSISKKLDGISDKTQEAIASQVQSERLKVELVTNVSHDLKTPLTSIVSYVDLLKKCELSDEARDYVKILSVKSDKLCDIVKDVFSLAKTVSGVEVNCENLDFAVLIRQVLADNEDKIAQANKDFKQSIKLDKAPIYADSIKLYRVIQNLFDNALKYSLDGTRVYVDFYSKANGYELTLKNVSAYEMNFTADEITERFARGDKSRTDGSSGLGLSIAKTFTESCGGRFEIDIDGDVFKASVWFEQREENISEEDFKTTEYP